MLRRKKHRAPDARFNHRAHAVGAFGHRTRHGAGNEQRKTVADAVGEQEQRAEDDAWFIPGGILRWERVFPAAADALRARTFESLPRRLLVTATDLEAGMPVVLRRGPVLPAVRATCAVPGVLPPERIDGRWLVDGGLVDLVPIDVASTTDPDVVVAVNVGSRVERRMPELDGILVSALTKLGSAFPNPATAKASFEVLVRASEIALGRTAELAAAMADADAVIEPDVGEIGLRDFSRLDDAVAAGHEAAASALPAIRRALDQRPPAREPVQDELLRDPVCRMVVSRTRARAHVTRDGQDYYFCSENCRDCFERTPARYARVKTAS